METTENEWFHDATVIERGRYGGESIIVWDGMGMSYNPTGVGYRYNISQTLVLSSLQVM